MHQQMRQPTMAMSSNLFIKQRSAVTVQKTKGEKKPLQDKRNDDETKTKLGKKRTRRSQPRSVTFDKTYEVCPILSLDEYGDKEFFDCWYQEDDYTLMTKECFKIIKKMQQGKPINARKYCVRGLERMTPEATDARDLVRMNAYIAVLEEQNTQMVHGVQNEKKIAKAYRKASAKTCQADAEKMAERDALFVAKLYADL